MTVEVTQALLPCPFCGGKAEIGAMYARCYNCDCEGPIEAGQDEEKAAIAWNTRHPDPLVGELVEAAHATQDDYQTSEGHHPDHILVTRAAFERLRTALARWEARHD